MLLANLRTPSQSAQHWVPPALTVELHAGTSISFFSDRVGDIIGFMHHFSCHVGSSVTNPKSRTFNLLAENHWSRRVPKGAHDALTATGSDDIGMVKIEHMYTAQHES